jgi:hypothetical protein
MKPNEKPKHTRRDVIWLVIDDQGHAELVRFKDDADRAREYLKGVRVVEYREHRPRKAKA